MALFGDTDYSVPGYVCAMRDAHRKPAQAIDPPAITWHLGFNRDTEYGSTDDEWIERVELLIIEIFFELVERDECAKQDLRQEQERHRAAHLAGQSGSAKPQCRGSVSISNLCTGPVTASHSDAGWSVPTPLRLLRHAYHVDDSKIARKSPLEPEGSRYETVVIQLYWKGLKSHMRFEMLEECFTITVTISLRSPERESHAGLNPYCTAFDEIVTTIDGKKRSLDGLATMKPDMKNVDTLYNTVWNEFSREIFSAPFSSLRDVERYSGETERDRSLRRLRAKRIGQDLFADFRGIIFEFEEGSKWSRYRHAVGQVDIERHTPHEDWLNASGKALENECGRQRADEMLSVLYAAQPPDDVFRPPFEATEYTFSTLNNKRCLFGTSFGWPQAKKPSPLLYVLLFAHDNQREIGLTVNLLHLLGTLRLSALRDFEKIISRSNMLERLDQEHQLLRKTLLDGDDGIKDSQHQATIDAAGYVDDMIELVKCRPHDDAFQYIIGKTPTEFVNYLKGEREFLTILQRQSEHPVRVRDWMRYLWRAEKRLRELQKSCDEVQKALAKRLDLLAQEQPPAWVERHALKSLLTKCSALLRRIDVLVGCRTAEAYRNKVVAQMEEALASMDERVRRGVVFRAEQAHQNMQRFKSLSQTLDIADIVGYQPYHRFVYQRLERSFNLILSVGARYRRLSEKIQKLRNEIDDETRLNRLVGLQIFAEFLTVVIIAPHYLSKFLHALADHVWPTAESTVVLTSYAMGFVFFVCRMMTERHTRERVKDWLANAWHGMAFAWTRLPVLRPR